MPRGQDAPTQGYTIDPYVAKSISERKAQAENRLVAAMQEAGATQRQREAQTGQLVQQGVQAANERQMLAAQLEAQDRRAAENEAARRDDNRHSKEMQNEQQSFIAEQNRLNLKADKDREDRARVARKEDLQMMLDNTTVQGMIDAESERERNKVILSIATMGQQGLTGEQKLITAFADDAEQAEMGQEVYNRVKENTKAGAPLDKRLDLLARKPGPGRLLPPGAWGVSIPADVLGKDVADPLGVFQDQVRRQGSRINVGDLMTDRIHNVEQQIVDKEIDKEDIRITISTLDGMKDVFASKMEDASEKDKEFWDDQIDDLTQMRLNIGQLMYSKKTIKDRQMEKVGGMIRSALGPIDGISTGSKVARIKAFGQTNADAAKAHLDGLRKAIEVPSLLTIPEGASPYMKTRINGINQGRMSAYPDVFPPNRGGD